MIKNTESIRSEITHVSSLNLLESSSPSFSPKNPKKSPCSLRHSVYYIYVALALWECVGISWTPEVCLTWPNNKGNSLHLSLFLLVSLKRSNQPTKQNYKKKMIMAMCTNKNKTLFWPACVRVCEHHTHFICMFSFYYWHSCRFFCLHIHIFIYTYTLRVCVHILLLLLLYIYIYILSVLWLTEYEHVPLCSRSKIFTEPMRCGSPLGSLEGNLFSLHFCMLFSLSFLSLCHALFYLSFAVAKYTGHE